MEYDKSDWERLAEAVRDRRASLDKSQIEVAQDGGLSLDRVSAIELAKVAKLMPKTIKFLERGLSWAPGSVTAILRGGDPSQLDETPANGPPAWIQRHRPPPSLDEEYAEAHGLLDELGELSRDDEAKRRTLEALRDSWRGKDAK